MRFWISKMIHMSRTTQMDLDGEWILKCEHPISMIRSIEVCLSSTSCFHLIPSWCHAPTRTFSQFLENSAEQHMFIISFSNKRVTHYQQPHTQNYSQLKKLKQYILCADNNKLFMKKQIYPGTLKSLPVVPGTLNGTLFHTVVPYQVYLRTDFKT